MAPCGRHCGNIFRGVKASASGMDRQPLITSVMIATVMNALTLQMPWNEWKCRRVQTAIAMQEVAEPGVAPSAT